MAILCSHRLNTRSQLNIPAFTALARAGVLLPGLLEQILKERAVAKPDRTWPSQEFTELESRTQMGFR